MRMRSSGVCARAGLAALLALFSVSCKLEVPRVYAVPSPAAAEPEKVSALVTIIGTYEVDPVRQGKAFQGTWLIPDGSEERLVITYRPDPSRYRYIGKRVVATGRHRVMSPEEQHILAPHFALETLTLAPGETPYPTDPVEIPAPPIAKSKAELAARVGKWTRVEGRVGTLEVSPHESHYVYKLIVALPDGYLIETRAQYLDIRWDQTKQTKDITVVGRVGKSAADRSSITIAFSAVCQGHIERCGM